MRVVEPGHSYQLECISGVSGKDTSERVYLRFVKRVGDHYPGNISPPMSGPTTQEVIRALIDRTKYVNNQIPDQRNDLVVDNLRQALYHLECRAAEERGEYRQFLDLVSPSQTSPSIELIETCPRCGHIACGRHRE